jgi:hypothetical protein
MKLRIIFHFLVSVLMTTQVNAQLDFFPSEVAVNASSLKLRAEANTTSTVLETLKRGTVLQVMELFNNGEVLNVDTLYAPWYKVKVNEKVGYVFGAYVVPTYGLYYEDDIFAETELPQLNWYGVYMRDSFSDEIRPIKVRLESEFNEFHGVSVKILTTNQSDESKFIIGTVFTLPVGYAGPLGITDSPGWFFEGGLAPGSMQSISSGYDMKTNAEVVGDTYFLAATGCAALKDNLVQVSGYQLQVFEMDAGASKLLQNLTPSVLPELGINPQIKLTWYGDLDHDNKPDMILHDCPVEMGCRASLFLTSKARPGELLHKMSEHFWYAD